MSQNQDMAETKLGAGALKRIGGRLCLDFTNLLYWRTTDHPVERLKGYSDLVSWGEYVGIVTPHEAHSLLRDAKRHRRSASGVHARTLQLREALYRIFCALANGSKPKAADLGTLNEVLSEERAWLRVVMTDDGFAGRWIVTRGRLDGILWPIARDAADLLISEEWGQVGVCAGEGCGWLFLDRSTNRSRRWCDMSDCGNRAKARRYYERTRKPHETIPGRPWRRPK